MLSAAGAFGGEERLLASPRAPLEREQPGVRGRAVTSVELHGKDEASDPSGVIIAQDKKQGWARRCKIPPPLRGQSPCPGSGACNEGLGCAAGRSLAFLSPPSQALRDRQQQQPLRGRATETSRGS